MTTLAKRATPLQAKLMRIVEGAVKNTIHAHPHLPAKALVSSIAKRAAGTLTAVWPDALAAGVPSDRKREALLTSREAASDKPPIPHAGGTLPIPPAFFDMLAQASVEGRTISLKRTNAHLSPAGEEGKPPTTQREGRA